jgi:hypothetical protein
MKRVECEFESEVLSAALQCRWPGRVDNELRAHVASCTICSDVIAVAGALDEAREDMHACTVVPDSGRVWWLAQLRARREAAEAAGRPITAAQVIALAAAMGLLGACVGATSKWFQSSLGWFGSSIAALRIPALLPSAMALVSEHGALVVAMAAIVLLVPAAVYFTMLRD